MQKLTEAAEKVKSFYNKEYYGESVKASVLPWHCRKIGYKFGDLSGKDVLDVACGTGEWLAFFNQRGATVSGIDISDVAIDVCKKKFGIENFFCGPAEELPFDGESFDLITCMGSLEHFLDKPKALLEMRRVARKDARIVILVPNAGFLTRKLGLYNGTKQASIKEDVYSLALWNELFESAGLKVIEKWPDLHPISIGWIARGNFIFWPVRAVQAILLAIWPLKWQYQVYHYCLLND